MAAAAENRGVFFSLLIKSRRDPRRGKRSVCMVVSGFQLTRQV